jgi:RNA polymerase sigma-70 factor (ECF subfamily)
MPPDHLPYSRMSDEVLVLRTARAEAPALAVLYDRHRMAAYGVARRVLHDDALAEDAVQEAFLGAWRSAGRFAPDRGAARTWLLMLVHRRAVDIVRRRGLVAVCEPDERIQPAAQEAIEAVAERDTVRGALRALPGSFRAPLALAYYLDLTQQECAERLREPIGTVKSRTARGLVRLRRELAGTVVAPSCE